MEDSNDTRQSNKPVKSIRYGAIEASIWENEHDDGKKSHAVTFSRSYKDGDDWKTSTSFRVEHLLLLAKAADQAHTAICTELQ